MVEGTELENNRGKDDIKKKMNRFAPGHFKKYPHPSGAPIHILVLR